MSPDDRFAAHLEALLRLRRHADGAVYLRALDAARVAVARVILAEAERSAGVGSDRLAGTVIKFHRPDLKRSDDGDVDA